MKQTDLFGGAAPAPSRGKHYVAPRGGADRPGTGPEGETCGSCKHIWRRETGARKVFPKCDLNRACWTRGAKTDIRVKWAACSKWEKPDEQA